MASKMAEISNTQDQYYLNYLQQKANNEREDTIRQEWYDREDAIRQEGYNRADTEKSFKDFLDGMSAFTTDEAKAKYAEGRIEEKDGKFYLDGRELTANEATRYKNALANLDQSTNSNASVGINGSGVEVGSDGAVYVNGSKVTESSDFGTQYHNTLNQLYDKDGNAVDYAGGTNMAGGNNWATMVGLGYFFSEANSQYGFKNEIDELQKLTKDSSFTVGTMIKLTNTSGYTTYAMWNGSKFVYVDDAKKVWDSIGKDYQISINNRTVTQGDKTKPKY